MKQAMVILNPSSGNEAANDYKAEIVEVVSDKGYNVTVKETKKQDDATAFAEEAVNEGYDYVVGAGGDGTINEVITGLAKYDNQPLFSFVPFGTVNDFARAIGIPLKPKAAIAWLKEADTEQRVDIGKVNDRYFVNVVALGAVAEATYDVGVEQKTRLGPLAYYIEGAKTLAENKIYPLTFKVGGETIEEEAFLVIIGMTNSIAGFERIATDAKLDDGHMHVFIVKKLAGFDIMTVLPSVLAGEFKDHEKVHYIKTNELTIESTQSLHTNIDGDEGDDLPLHLTVLPKHIRLLKK
ncbi:lipid kinase, YegS/Rv2252/BmrU family [Halolactibacillus halophilus]|uniref:Diacylglycerol kinase n=2 Tax=Halolactibacillus halophilus TaxID=306540 RepID=A0A1I5MBN3_9BACI|nr:diacylglycerol kinase family protein [Halolactibacillus halophilus]GEM02070.1 diacylglycerol kinase [Halolactibacillus halophilus]SFP07038.1 lipid kinase, YegS/Rv2252/BmrU family [Halolactibacillus halophilus]